MNVVTLSATYGTGGPLIGQRIADQLGVPFIDRAIPVDVANRLGVTVEHAMARDEQVRGWLARMLMAAAPISSDYHAGCEPPHHALLSDAEFVACTRAAIRKAIEGRGGVILGRAGAVVLRDHPGALHVRLDGAPERRLRLAMRWLKVGEEQAREDMAKNDNARAAYVRHFYRVDAAAPEHYHLTLDPTRVSFDACADIIVAAARADHPVG
jgi:cytidylate kinase